MNYGGSYGMNVFDSVDTIRVELDNIRTFQNRTYEFYRGLNLIVGNNGSGKTTLVSSLYVGLYGRIPSSTLTLKRMITRGERKGSIQVTMSSMNNSFVVRREYSPSLSNTEIYMNSVKLNSVDEVFDSEVMKLIYVNLLDRVDFSSYINFDQFYERMKKYKDKISRDCADLENQVRSMDMVMQTHYSQIEEKELRLSQIIDEQRILDTEITTLKSSLSSTDITDVMKRFNDLTYLLTNFSNIKQKLLDDRRKAYTVKVTESKQLLSNIRNEYNMKAQQLQKLYSDKLNQVKNNYSISIASINGNITSIDTQTTKLLNLLKIPNSTCPVCNSSIDTNHVQKEVDRLQLEKNQLQNEVKKLQEQMNSTVTSIQNEYSEKVTQLQKEYQPIVSKLQQQIQEFETTLQTITISDDDVALQHGFNSYSDLKSTYLQLQQIVSIVQSIKEKESRKVSLIQRESEIRDEIKSSVATIQKLQERKKELEEKLTDLLKTNEVFERVLDKKKMKQFMLARVADKINLLASTVNELPIKVYAFVEDEKVGLMFKNSYGSDVQFDELSSGEKVMATIISLFIYRKLLSSLNYTIPKIVVFDELLDRLDYNNAYNVLHFLSKLDDHIILIVTHREDIMQLSEEIQMNVVKLS